MAEAIVIPLANGPYLVSSPVTLVDVDGNAFVVQGDTVAPYRCDGSSNKPFCDRTHKRIGFT